MESDYIEYLRKDMIGNDLSIETPFGVKPLVYLDYTASGRSLKCIENYIEKNVLPVYANTHTHSSFTGNQTSNYREQSRKFIKKFYNCDDQNYSLIFTGSGATAAINKLIFLLNFQECVMSNVVLFTSCYEHHSNDLPWRELGCKIIKVPLSKRGDLDLCFLKQQLEKNNHYKVKIGSFSGASNVTGIKTDLFEICKLIKSYNGLVFFDLATLGPYELIDFKKIPLDACFISPHKFIGGPGTPGILIIKNNIVKANRPHIKGGGTVNFVSRTIHQYTTQLERREEGGTPDIIGSIRCGLLYQKYSRLNFQIIEKKEKDILKRFTDFFKNNKNVELLGGYENTKKLNIFSFRILNCHYNLGVTLFNDLFGIQCRGGCSCAGSYAHELLNIPESRASEISKEIQNGNYENKPGWIRFNIHFILSNDEINYVLAAINIISKNIDILKTQYFYNAMEHRWQHLKYDSNIHIKKLDLYNEINPIHSLLNKEKTLKNTLKLIDELINDLRLNKINKLECV